MSWRHPRVLIAVSSTALVLSVALVDLRRSSPGELSAIHARELARAGETGCAACHGGLLESMAHACLDCHEAIDAQLERGLGLHGTLDPARAERCALCHSEHHGAGFALVHRQSFSLAGVEDPEAFDHGLVALTLEGRHLELACAECHEHADAELLPEDAQRFLGLDRTCAACHEDPHEGRMAHACASCHDQAHEFAAPAFPQHGRHLELVGGHAGLDCRACHGPDEPHALERLGRDSGPPPRGCTDCHESPHAPRFEAQEAGCAACHEAAHERFADSAGILTRAQHAATGFPLTAPHDAQACADCHDPTYEAFGARHPGRRADDCAACHGDPHAGQFAQRADAAQGCLACHERARFDPHTFDVARHETTGFALEGAHLETDCERCHVLPTPDAARRFRDTPARCEACHEDAHRGAFDARAELLAANEAGDCAECHAPTEFRDVPRGRFEHGRFTDFALEGAHAVAACESCHERAPLADDLGRRFGRAQVGPHGAGDCRDCHADPHAGRFDGAHAPASFEGNQGCARCHGAVSFRALTCDFDHGLWTAWPLEGAHAPLACAECHPSVRTASGVGRGPAAGADCASCHDDAHGGQFLEDGAQRCERCHQSAADFRELVFDHDRDSRFPLDGSHESLACAACHKTVREKGVELVRYKPLGAQCADCHGTQRSFLRRREERAR